MHRKREERESLWSPLELYGHRGATEETEEVEFPTFSEEEEMRERRPSRREFPRLPFASGNDDDWKVGAWTSSAGVCKSAGRSGREGTAVGPKKALSAGMGGASSFESLDIRATEILGRSIQALESCSSLTSCALAMTMNSRPWEEGSCEVEEEEQQGGRSHHQDSAEQILLYPKGGATMDSHRGDRMLDIIQVLKEIVNNSGYAAKLSTAVKTFEGTIDKMAGWDLNTTNIKENLSEKDKLESVTCANARLWNGSSKISVKDGECLLSRTALGFSNDNNGALGGCSTPANLELSQEISVAQADGGEIACKMGFDVKGSTIATQERPTQTNLTRLSGCKMRPPKVQGSGTSRLPTRPNGEFQRKHNLVAWQRRKLCSSENSHGAKSPNQFKHKKLVWPSKPPKWNGLSTAFSAVRSMCHGAGEAGVVDVQARPLLIVAGKCVFRAAAPLDTPRPPTTPHQRRSLVSRASNAHVEGSHPTGSPDASTAHTRKAVPQTLPTGEVLLLLPRTSDGLPIENKCRAPAQSIRRWPPVIAELDNWISEVRRIQDLLPAWLAMSLLLLVRILFLLIYVCNCLNVIVNEWLDKDDHLAALPNYCLCNPSVTIGSPVLSSTLGVCLDKKQGVLGPLQAKTALEPPESLPILLTKITKTVSAPSKELTELDARIGQAQTVHDLCQILEPVSQVAMSGIADNKVDEDVKISPALIIQEFGSDDIVQDFQRQIHVLEQEIKDLKSSLCKQEHSVLRQGLRAFTS